MPWHIPHLTHPKQWSLYNIIWEHHYIMSIRTALGLNGVATNGKPHSNGQSNGHSKVPTTDSITSNSSSNDLLRQEEVDPCPVSVCVCGREDSFTVCVCVCVCARARARACMCAYVHVVCDVCVNISTTHVTRFKRQLLRALCWSCLDFICLFCIDGTHNIVCENLELASLWWFTIHWGTLVGLLSSRKLLSC